MSPTPLGVLAVTALAAGAICMGMMVVLERRYGNRAWRWAIAIPVFLFAYQNWDIFAMAALFVGLLAFERGRDLAAGAALGMGAAVKLFPAFAVPPLVALRCSNGDRRARSGWCRGGRVRRGQPAGAGEPVGLVVAVLVPVEAERDLGQRVVLPVPPSACPCTVRAGRSSPTWSR